MGVTGLWQIVHPCARPIKLETLNRKRLAVDASIWIYQFLKAVRDKEGNALRNSHVVGFFRRICKLLFVGIKPVFVFDGGAPVLKRQTISERKKRREGRREDAVRTAGRLLAVQMQRRAEEDEQRRRNEQTPAEEEEVPDEGLVYADENLMTAQERQQNRRFKKKDAYHLPNLDVSVSEMGGPDDPRVMSLEELQSYAKQFEAGEDINVYDFSKIDYDSPFFTSLPASDRYNILNAARLRSRLRMGYTKEQLDGMFPDRMAFSKFQIERVAERNNLTQRLMHLNESGDTLFNGGRVAGERGREYVLVKNDGVEGGWALGVISDEGTKQENAIDLDRPEPVMKQEDEEWEDDEDFEDVPIEGLNRLPKQARTSAGAGAADAYTKQRQELYKTRKSKSRKPRPAADPESLFVQDEPAEEEEEEWEEVDGNAELFGGPGQDEDDEDLRRAIAMSLGEDQPEHTPADRDGANAAASDEEDDEMFEVFNQTAVPDARPLPKGSGRSIANMVNKRAFDVAPESHEITSFGVPAPRSPEPQNASDSDDETMDFQAALAESRRTKRKVSPPPRRRPAAAKPVDSTSRIAKQAGFSGPLPFEKLDLGTSLLGKKKMQERTEESAGGFVNPELEDAERRKKAGPLPPWFSGDLDEDMEKQKALEYEDRERAKEFSKQFQFQGKDDGGLRRRDTGEVIDLEADDGHVRKGEVIDLDGEDGYKHPENGEIIDVDAEDEADPGDGMVTFDPEMRMGDMAEKIRVEPPSPQQNQVNDRTPRGGQRRAPFAMDDSDNEKEEEVLEPPHKSSGTKEIPTTNTDSPPFKSTARQTGDEETLDWSASEDGQANSEGSKGQAQRSPSAEFEDVEIPDSVPSPQRGAIPPVEEHMDMPAPASGAVPQDTLAEDDEDYGLYSDPEDEELLHGLALEAEEHARFASTLNNKSQAQNIADYERELKQLRNQQKKDRRDADEVTHIMVQECQQLLRLFGLPYVTAPMEAEAQCAELVKLGLVDGIVTDDSDCFLFGGTRIYKNMFNQAKFVECYLTSDLEKEFDLTREKMISVAHLLGSDYTEGLPGVGPVTALEIIGEFATLEDFRDWLTGVQMNTITKADDAGNAFRKKFRRSAAKLYLPQSFPDARVSIAYTTPDVDSDPEQFQWGVPDLDALRAFLMATIGWSPERTDEVLVPVIKDMNRRADEGTQSNITNFFDGGVGIGAAGATKDSARGEAFAPRKRVAESSKRMGSALNRMAEKARLGRSESVTEEASVNQDVVAAEADVEQSDAREPARKPNRAKKGGRAKRKTPVSDDDDDEGEYERPKKRTTKKRK